MSTRRRIGAERQYYSPPAMRKNNLLQQQQQQGQLKDKSLASLLSDRKGSASVSYLDRFLDHTTPVVAAQHLPRTTLRAWQNRGRDVQPFFVLGDLWESFREWSVYGVGVPLPWNGCDSVVQYYVPSLSGIQLYIDPTRHALDQRRPGEESDATNSSRDTCSDSDNEYGGDRGTNAFQASWNQKSTIGQGHSKLQGRNNASLESLIDRDDVTDPPGRLVFEYFERELPFHREPLADKMSTLALRFPELKTYRSCDLTQSSWISVAWYPIYRIPVGPTLQNIDACFLTFHSLTKPVKGGEGVRDYGNKLLLPSFGLVTYKFKVADSSGNGIQEGQKANSLLHSADNWLRQLQVNHPDYNFFMSHNTYQR